MILLNEEPLGIKNRGLNPLTITCGDISVNNDNTHFKNQILASKSGGLAQLPKNPGFEIHPYKHLLSYSNQSKIIIGTFPPVSYLIDIINQQNPGVNLQRLLQPTAPNQHIKEPQIPFFHGNVSALWSVLLNADELNDLSRLVPEQRNEAKQYLIQKLHELGIFYDDIILSTQRQLGKLPKPHNNLGYTYEDINLKNICPDLTLLQKVLTNENLKIVSFTNGAIFRSGNSGGIKIFSQKSRNGIVNTSKSDALSLFLRTCQEIGLKTELRCLPYFDWTDLTLLSDIQKRTKLIFELRLIRTKPITISGLQDFQQKEFTVITPYSPAAHGKIESHPIVSALRRSHGTHHTAAQLLSVIYGHLRNNTYDQLFRYNINQ